MQLRELGKLLAEREKEVMHRRREEKEERDGEMVRYQRVRGRPAYQEISENRKRKKDTRTL